MALSLLRRSCFLPSSVLVRTIKHYQVVREEIPEDDLGTLDRGEQIIPPPPIRLTGVTESKEEWIHVENILPKTTVPPPPEQSVFPTPSGWVPPNEKALENPYLVQRTRYHNFPLYLESHDGGHRKMTVIKKIEGDIWAMEADLRGFLHKLSKKPVYTQVDEVCRKIRVRGIEMENVSQFLLAKGM